MHVQNIQNIHCTSLYKKINSSKPFYGTLEDTTFCSQITMPNIHPFPFFFQSNPLSESPTIFKRRAGWSPEIALPSYPKTYEHDDKIEDFCFQAACNTVFTEVKGKDGKCAPKDCVVLFR